MTYNAFIFDRYDFDPKSGVLSLGYGFEGGPSFEERIVFAPPYKGLDAQGQGVLDRVFRLIFLLAGVSYYKAYVPQTLKCKAFELDAASALWLEKLYRLGLGEFAHRNGIDLDGHIRFEAHGTQMDAPIKLPQNGRLLVPIGGGKDSVVTLEALKEAGKEVAAFALCGAGGPAKPIADTIAVSGAPQVQVVRTLSPNLMQLNEMAGVYNGHVPITAILSAIALAACVLYGYDGVVMSNERSASVPNFDDVNHQYSKSFEFEQDLASYVGGRISADLGYWSFLRPCSEVDIARRFAKLEAYHDVFRSCNTAFRQDAAARGKHWCCDCPKCRFVFLALAPFMPKERLCGIFGKNMLADAVQLDGFAALCGLGDHKPFECVGEVEESARLMKHLSTLPDWKDEVVVAFLAPQILQGPDLAPLLDLSAEHALPLDLYEVLRGA